MKNKNAFSHQLLNWFYENKRDLPFRTERDPYKIWISEIMAQQTQIATLIPYYERFVSRFPNVTALAEAEETEVLKLWEGLGYYSRARNLHKAAKVIANEHQGIFPSTYEQIIKLPGIGSYTGGAIASIAFGMKVSAIDGNVLRVITRTKGWFDDITLPETKAKVTQWVIENMPDDPGDYNEALMELGALICTPKNPICDVCPVHDLCAAYADHVVDQLPVKSKKTKQKQLQVEVAAVRKGNAYYLIKRPTTGLLAGLWAFPSCEADKNSEPGTAITALISQRFPNLPKGEPIGAARHVFTHRVWNMTLFGFTLPDNDDIKPLLRSDEEIYSSLNEIEKNIPLPTAFSKLIPFLGKKNS